MMTFNDSDSQNDIDEIIDELIDSNNDIYDESDTNLTLSFESILNQVLLQKDNIAGRWGVVTQRGVETVAIDTF